MNPGSIWYTPISGIWQTVWLEPVNENHITKLEINHDYDSKEVKITFKLNSDEKLPLNVKLEFDEKEVKAVKGKSNEEGRDPQRACGRNPCKRRHRDRKRYGQLDAVCI